VQAVSTSWTNETPPCLSQERIWLFDLLELMRGMESKCSWMNPSREGSSAITSSDGGGISSLELLTSAFRYLLAAWDTVDVDLWMSKITNRRDCAISTESLVNIILMGSDNNRNIDVCFFRIRILFLYRMLYCRRHVAGVELKYRLYWFSLVATQYLSPEQRHQHDRKCEER